MMSSHKITAFHKIEHFNSSEERDSTGLDWLVMRMHGVHTQKYNGPSLLHISEKQKLCISLCRFEVHTQKKYNLLTYIVGCHIVTAGSVFVIYSQSTLSSTRLEARICSSK